MRRLCFVLAILFIPRCAFASCVAGIPLCQSHTHYEAIFDGTVTSIDRLDLPTETAGSRQEIIGHRLVTFSVHKSWRGVSGREVQLFFWGGFGAVRSEQLEVALGRRYAIFANRGEYGYLEASGCSPSALYESAASTLAFLESLEKPPTGGRVFGSIRLDTPSFREEPVPQGRVTTTVTLSSSGLTRTVESRNGEFEFTSLPPGEYTLRVRVPPSLAVDRAERALSLADARACSAEFFAFRLDTTIAGTLLTADAKAVKGIPVALADAASWTRRPNHAMTAYTDAAGGYQFNGVPPGRYVVGVNPLDDIGLGSRYPRAMYPGGESAPEAITLEADGKLILSPMRIRGPLARITLDIQAVWDDGRPGAAITVRLEDVTGSLSSAPRTIFGTTADAAGWMRMEALASRTYQLAVWAPSGGRLVRVGVSRPFDPSPNPLRVVLERPK